MLKELNDKMIIIQNSETKDVEAILFEPDTDIFINQSNQKVKKVNL